MKITVIGTGYVGLVSGTCFAEMGIDVTCVDVDAAKIDALRSGVVPIYEPGLDELIRKNMECGRLHFSTSLPDSLRNSEVVFIAVGTPAREDGSADLHYVFDVAAEIGETLDHYTVVVTKSTVPVGTSFKVKSLIADALSRRGATIDFDIANNPEFLKEGAAIKDFMSPDRVVIGVENERAEKIMRRLYKPFIVVNDRIQITDIASSEMIKYASNAMLATRISFMNDIANLCELVGADFNKVRKGVGSDTRIGNKFLYAGCGYGGSCFPKDVKALVSTAERYGYEMRVLKAVEDVNQRQKQILFDKLVRRFLHDGFQFSCLCRHGKHLIELVAALVVLHGHGLGVWRPLEPVKVILVFNELGVCLHPCSRAYVEYAGIELWQLVARFRIFLFVQIRLQLVPW